jgi:hypothetical protein
LFGSTATAKVRKHPTAGIAYTFSTVTTVADGTVKIFMQGATTANLPSGRCYYDLIITSSAGLPSKVVQGNVLVEETASL